MIDKGYWGRRGGGGLFILLSFVLFLCFVLISFLMAILGFVHSCKFFSKMFQLFISGILSRLELYSALDNL